VASEIEVGRDSAHNAAHGAATTIKEENESKIDCTKCINGSVCGIRCREAKHCLDIF